MSALQNWLDAWKAQAQTREQWLSQALSQAPRNPAAASVRSFYLKRAQQAVNNQRNWGEAWVSHLKSVSNILSNQPSKTGPSARGGSLGDAG
jgi:hypothetical protein